MLVLTRRAGEIVDCTLPTGETLRIHVIRLQGRSVKLGFTAPDTVQIHRAEAHCKTPQEHHSEVTTPTAHRVRHAAQTTETKGQTCQPDCGREHPEGIV